MRILLTSLNSKYIHSTLALKYLYSMVADLGHEVEIKEFTINNEKDHVYGEILRGGYDMVCISSYIWNIELVKELGANLKKARPLMRIVLGGPEVSYNSHSFMAEHRWVDFIIRGEGEMPFRQFCQQLEKSIPDFTQVSNLTWRDERPAFMFDQIHETADGPLPSMDEIPFPYTHLEVETDRMIYYESSRGCPFRCAYCLSAETTAVRPLSMGRLKRDIAYLMYKGVRQIKFIDRAFNYDRARANEIWKFIIEKDNGHTNFHFEVNGDLLDADSFRILGKARPGLFQFEIGIQTANPYALEAVHRNPDVSQILHNVRKLMVLGNIHVHVDLIAGLPKDTYKTFGHSFDLVYDTEPDCLQLGFLKVLEGTPMQDLVPVYHYEYRDKAPYEVISNDYMPSIDLIKLKMIETVFDYYYNRGGFRSALKNMIEELGITPFRFYELLADFYYKHGYHEAYHKKETLYRIFYQFAESMERYKEGIALRTQQCLTTDMIGALNEDAVKRFNKKGWSM